MTFPPHFSSGRPDTIYMSPYLVGGWPLVDLCDRLTAPLVGLTGRLGRQGTVSGCIICSDSPISSSVNRLGVCAVGSTPLAAVSRSLSGFGMTEVVVGI